MTTTAPTDTITVRLRECWVRADNLRLSRTDQPWPEPHHKAVVVESVEVRESDRRQGVFKRFISELCQKPGIDLFIVEAVQNPILAEALMRWGWDFDSHVMDFYFWPGRDREPTT